jgi:hypothetical protein
MLASLKHAALEHLVEISALMVFTKQKKQKKFKMSSSLFSLGSGSSKDKVKEEREQAIWLIEEQRATPATSTPIIEEQNIGRSFWLALNDSDAKHWHAIVHLSRPNCMDICDLLGDHVAKNARARRLASEWLQNQLALILVAVQNDNNDNGENENDVASRQSRRIWLRRFNVLRVAMDGADRGVQVAVSNDIVRRFVDSICKRFGADERPTRLSAAALDFAIAAMRIVAAAAAVWRRCLATLCDVAARWYEALFRWPHMSMCWVDGYRCRAALLRASLGDRRMCDALRLERRAWSSSISAMVSAAGDALERRDFVDLLLVYGSVPSRQALAKFETLLRIDTATLFDGYADGAAHGAQQLAIESLMRARQPEALGALFESAPMRSDALTRRYAEHTSLRAVLRRADALWCASMARNDGARLRLAYGNAMQLAARLLDDGGDDDVAANMSLLLEHFRQAAVAQLWLDSVRRRQPTTAAVAALLECARDASSDARVRRNCVEALRRDTSLHDAAAQWLGAEASRLPALWTFVPALAAVAARRLLASPDNVDAVRVVSEAVACCQDDAYLARSVVDAQLLGALERAADDAPLLDRLAPLLVLKSMRVATLQRCASPVRLRAALAKRVDEADDPMNVRRVAAQLLGRLGGAVSGAADASLHLAALAEAMRHRQCDAERAAGAVLAMATAAHADNGDEQAARAASQCLALALADEPRLLNVALGARCTSPLWRLAIAQALVDVGRDKLPLDAVGAWLRSVLAVDAVDDATLQLAFVLAYRLSSASRLDRGAAHRLASLADDVLGGGESSAPHARQVALRIVGVLMASPDALSPDDVLRFAHHLNRIVAASPSERAENVALASQLLAQCE